MKIFKRTVSFFLAFCLCAGMLLVQPQANVSAASTEKTTTTQRVYSKSSNNYAIRVNLPANQIAYVTNVKTSSKNLIAKTTYYYVSTYSDNPYANIGLYAKKTGKYKVTYDISDKTGNVLSSGAVTVYAKDDLPVKSVKFAGKDVVSYYLTNAKTGKLNVTMNKGYKLKSITVTTYDKNGKDSTKTVKNGSSIKLGEYARVYSNKYANGNSYYSTSLAARTEIKITYTDKYTKQESQYSYTLSRLAK